MQKFLKLVLILAFVATSQASYATVEFDLGTVINGSMPSGSAPWMTATFANGAADHVTLTLTNDMGSGQFISDLVFNSLINPTNLLFSTPYPNISSISVTVGQTQDGGSSLKAGLFNIDISFTHNGPTHQFNSGNGPAIFDISGTGLTENSFNLLSLDGGPGFLGTDYLMAAKVQGIPVFGSTDTTSGSIGFTSVSAVPEPEIYAMMGVGLLMMGFVAHRRRQQGSE